MIVAGSASPLLLASAAGGYNLTRSLRFRASADAYLNRTPASAGNRRTFTISAWVKRGLLTPAGIMFSARIDNNNRSDIYFNPTGITFQLVNAGTTRLIDTSAVFRDPSSWYHIVAAFDTTQATDTNRIKLYINGVQQTITSSLNGFPTQNMDTMFNNNSVQRIGVNSFDPQSSYFDGYMTEVIMVDGQALTPSSFGQTDTKTGVWQPKKYAGTYGTNGYYLPFTDNSALTTSSNVGLGKDFSGNGNYWTTNNISITSGSTYDSMTDVPTLTSETQANYCVLNPLDKRADAGTLTNGNLTFAYNSTGTPIRSTIMPSSGKWYVEVSITAASGNHNIGVISAAQNINTSVTQNVYYRSTGEKVVNGSVSSYGASYTTNDIVGIAADFDAGTITFYKNNVSQGAISYTLSAGYGFGCDNASGTTEEWNFGQRPFAYTPPTGFVALNTFNLPTPTIGATASTQANKYFDISLWTGNQTARSITNSGSMQPDFVWIKERTNINWNGLADSIRGVDKYLFSNETIAEITDTSRITSFNSNGFSLGTSTAFNANSQTYVGWQWNAASSNTTNTSGTITSTVRANTTSGFSIVTYTGNGSSSATIGHGLGIAPKTIIIKRRDASSNWPAQFGSFGPPQEIIYFLNLTNGYNYPAPTYWNNTAPTSTVFTVGSDATVNASGGSYVAYCFSEIAGYSKIGRWTGNGSADGTFVYTGFRPRFILSRPTSDANYWAMFDTARAPFNVTSNYLAADQSIAEQSFNSMDILSNGFKLRSTNSFVNGGSTTYEYLAFAENPFKYSLAR